MSRRQRRRRQDRRTNATQTRRGRGRGTRLALGAGIAAGAVFGTAGAAQAADFTVTNLDDAGDGSLRDAVADANADPSPDRVLFQSGLSGAISLTSGEIGITEPVEIIGPDRGIDIDAGGNSRIFGVDAGDGGPVTISDVGLFSGYTAEAGGGGAIFVTSGDLILNRVRMAGNYATGGPGGHIVAIGTDSSVTVLSSELEGGNAMAGGAIGVAGADLTIRETTISSSSSAESGGAILTVGANAVTIERSTISGNQTGSQGGGGGLLIGPGSAVTVSSSTIADNEAGDQAPAAGGGAYVTGPGATLTLDSTIVADNTAYQGSDIFRDPSTGTVDATASLIEDSPDGTINGTDVANIEDEDPELGPLSPNGGPNSTHALAPSSPAIDQGTGTIADQRGVPRPVDQPLVPDGAAPDANGADIGAFELQSSGDHVVTNLDGDGPGSLRAALVASNDFPAPKTVSFQPGLTGTIPLGGEELLIRQPVEIDGPGADKITVDGQDQSRVLTVDHDDSDAGSTISGLKLANGHPFDDPGGGAGIQLRSGDLTVTDSELTGNEALTGSTGGAIGTISFSGTLTIESSTIAGNSANAGGGIQTEGELIVRSSTISGNEAVGDGGGIYFNGSSGTINDTTIAGNEAGDVAGGLFNYSSTVDPFLGNSIVAGNTSVNGEVDVSGDATAAFSLFGSDPSGVNTTIPGSNLFHTDPLLEPLALNGGTTRTRALPQASFAVDQGRATDPDQRGVSRPMDLASVPNAAASGANGADIGSFELEGATQPPPGGGGQTPATPVKPKPKKCKKKPKKGKSAAAKKRCKKRKRR